MIIALMGKKGSGKDTVGAYLMKEHGFERRAFADAGKRYMAEALDIPFHEIENFKNDPTVVVATGYKNLPTGNHIDEWDKQPKPNAMWSPIREQTFREFTQNFIENAKNTFGEDVWARKTLPFEGFYSGRKIVITDLRFEVEHERIRELNGCIVKLHRPGLVDEDPHRSEIEQNNLSYDYWIENSSLDELYKEIERMLEITS